MQPIYMLAIIIVIAYILQIIFGMKQLKHFNDVYAHLRTLGRVAIGRRSGKLRAGTIVMIAVDKKGKVLEASRMQGVTVLSRFKDMPNYVDQDIHYLDTYNPIVRKENRLTQIAIEDAREVFLRVEAGNYEGAQKVASAFDLGTSWQLFKAKVKYGFKSKKL